MKKRTDLQRNLTDQELGRSIYRVSSLISASSIPFDDFLVYIVDRAKEAGDGDFTVLDVGCGLGNALITLREVLGKISDVRARLRLIGLDVNPLAPEDVALPDNINLLSADAKAMPILDGSMDLGFSVASMQYFDDALRALEEGYRVLKPGGKFFWLINDSSDVSFYPHLGKVFGNTPGARDVFSWEMRDDDDHSLIVCSKLEVSDFKGFPYRRRFSLPALFPTRLVDFHKKRTVYGREK